MTNPQPAPPDPDDAVDAEWRKIEAERIAEEVEEAREDVLVPEPRSAVWPWWAFAAVLVAGTIFALAINAPGVSRLQPQPPGVPGDPDPAGGRP